VWFHQVNGYYVNVFLFYVLFPFNLCLARLLLLVTLLVAITILRSRDSAVGIATGYGLDDRNVGVRVPVGSRIFSTSSRPALGPTQPPL
jgi:hypothetical protein